MATNDSEYTADIDALRESNKRFYEAFGTLDITEMDSVWEPSEAAMCVHPGWPPIVGWEEIRESWRRIFENTSLMLFNVQYVNAVIRGDAGWVTCVENISSVLQGQASNFGVLSTNIFVRSLHGWRMIAHHASSGG